MVSFIHPKLQLGGECQTGEFRATGLQVKIGIEDLEVKLGAFGTWRGRKETASLESLVTKNNGRMQIKNIKREKKDQKKSSVEVE